MVKGFTQVGCETPWGPSQCAEVIADGIVAHDTAGHGGIWLSAERHKALQAKFKYHTFAGGSWYEEDCDQVAVVLAFPEFFQATQVVRAINAANIMQGWETRDGNRAGNWTRALKYVAGSRLLSELWDARKNVAEEVA